LILRAFLDEECFQRTSVQNKDITIFQYEHLNLKTSHLFLDIQQQMFQWTFPN